MTFQSLQKKRPISRIFAVSNNYKMMSLAKLKT